MPQSGGITPQAKAHGSSTLLPHHSSWGAGRKAMFQRSMRVVVVFTLVMALIGTAQLASAQPPYPTPDQPTEPSAEAILADVIFLRPAGFIATVLGTAIYIISLPVSLPTRSANAVAEKMVLAPGRYTFTRPIGVPDSGPEPDVSR
jgi:hypothetical protein